MPNWCLNALKLRHDDVSMIERAIKAEEFLTEFIPTPKELVDTMSGTHGDKDAQRDLDEQERRNLIKYGFKNWYEWNNAKWGTKWDFKLTDVERIDDHTITASFDSAWSPPTAAYDILSEMGFRVNAKFYEPGYGFCGTYLTDCGTEFVNLNDFTSETIRDEIGPDLDDYFGISVEMRDNEEMQP